MCLKVVLCNNDYEDGHLEAVAEELLKTGLNHYKLFWGLREHFRIEGEQFFQLTAKAHSCCHSCVLSGEINPRKVWCFKFEDYMGHMRRLASSCRTAYGVEVGKNMIQKWRVAQDWLFKYGYVLKE